MNQIVNAVKFFYIKVLNPPKAVYDLPKIKRPFQLPGIFSQNEVKANLDTAGKRKHRCMLELAYAGGIRVSELTSSQVGEIDFERMVGYMFEIQSGGMYCTRSVRKCSARQR